MESAFCRLTLDRHQLSVISSRRADGTQDFSNRLAHSGTREVDMPDIRENPKLDPDPNSNTLKNPDDWVSGDETMTGAQASYLTTLCEEAKGELPRKNLSKAEASKLIRVKLGR
jgi:hypothetical protein